MSHEQHGDVLGSLRFARFKLSGHTCSCGMTQGVATLQFLAAHVFAVGDALLLLLLGVVRAGQVWALTRGWVCRPLVTRG